MKAAIIEAIIDDIPFCWYEADKDYSFTYQLWLAYEASRNL